MGLTRYPAAARLHRPAEFAAALKGRWRVRGAWLVLSAAPAGQVDASRAAAPEPTRQNATRQNAVPQARLGLVIAKRFAPLAVTRNALKRVIREAFRQQRHVLPARDYVVRLHTKVGGQSGTASGSLSLRALKRAARAEVDGHFQRALRC